MGIDSDRFVGSNHEHFKCPVCLDVIEKPVERSCGHILCKSCHRPQPCPVCRNTDQKYQNIRNPTLISIYDQLQLKCINKDCKEVLGISNYKEHDCLSVKCGTCQAKYPKEEAHDCVQYLLAKVQEMEVSNRHAVEQLIHVVNRKDDRIRQMELSIQREAQRSGSPALSALSVDMSADSDDDDDEAE